HDPAVRVDRLVDVLPRAEGGDDDRHLVLDDRRQVLGEPVVGAVDDQIDGEGGHVLVRVRLGVGGVALGDLLEPLGQRRLRPGVEGRERTDHAGLTLRRHQLGAGVDEHRRREHRDRQRAGENRGKSHGSSFRGRGRTLSATGSTVRPSEALCNKLHKARRALPSTAGYSADMVRASWWALAAIATAFSLWFGATATMADVDMGCAKVAESGADFRCDHRVSDVMGAWPLLGLGFLLATPPVVAAVAGRMWVSCVAVVVLIAVTAVGLANWTHFWGTLLFAFQPRAPRGRRDRAPAGASATARNVAPAPRPGRIAARTPQRTGPAAQVLRLTHLGLPQRPTQLVHSRGRPCAA